jgi:hypothetical protein
MHARRRSALLCLLLAAAPVAPRAADAQPFRYFETVDVAHRRADDFELAYDGDVTGGDDASTLGDIFAQLAGPRYRGSASVDRFGNVGLQAELLAPEQGLGFHKLRSRTSVSASPAFVNIFPYAVHVYADFVLDGGALFLVGTTGSFARWELALSHTAVGEVFSTIGRYEVGPGPTPTLTTFGTDIGAAVLGPGRVVIPLSFQTADLGIVQPGEQVYLSYRLEIEVGLGVGAEIATASFSDPFSVAGAGAAGAFRAVPAAVTAAPEPGTLLLTAGGLAVLLGRARRRRAAR